MQGFFQRYLMLYRPLISKLNEVLGKYNLTYSLWQVILYIKNNGPSTLVEISSYYNIEKPTITRVVTRLEEKQFIIGKTGKDRREKIIHLTEAGEDIYSVCRNEITELECQIMKGIPESEQLAGFQLLPKIRENIIKGIGNE